MALDKILLSNQVLLKGMISNPQIFKFFKFGLKNVKLIAYALYFLVQFSKTKSSEVGNLSTESFEVIVCSNGPRCFLISPHNSRVV